MHGLNRILWDDLTGRMEPIPPGRTAEVAAILGRPELTELQGVGRGRERWVCRDQVPESEVRSLASVRTAPRSSFPLALRGSSAKA